MSQPENIEKKCHPPHTKLLEGKNRATEKEGFSSQDPRELINDLKKKYEITLNILAQAEKEKTQAKQLAATVQEECHSLREQQKTLRTMIARSKNCDEHLSKLERLTEELNSEKSLSEDLRNELDHAKAQNSLQSQRIEKLLLALKNQEGKLNELQQFEYGFKRAHQQRNHLENHLETEQNINNQLKEEIFSLQSALTESKNHSLHLETVIQHLREKSEESQLEAQQLEREYESAQGTIEIYQEQLKKNDEELQQLRTTLSDFNEKYVASGEELSSLRNQLVTMKESVKVYREELKHYEDLKNEKLRLEEVVKEIEVALKKATEERLHLDHSFKQLQCDHRDYKIKLQESIKEKNLAMSKFYQIQNILEGERGQIRSLEEKLRFKDAELKKSQDKYYQSENKIKELQTQVEAHEMHQAAISRQMHDLTNALQEKNLDCDQLKIKLDLAKIAEQEKIDLFEKYDQLKAELSELSELYEEALERRFEAEKELDKITLEHNETKTKIVRLEEESDSLNNALADQNGIIEQLKEQLNEIEAKFIEAQQHLGKKVKEVAENNETIEEMNERIGDLENELKMYKRKAEEAKGAVDFHQQQEKRLQDQISKWEEKYFKVYEQWQDADAQKKEFKYLQERHQQLQALLSNLGNFMGGNIPTPLEKPSFDQPIQELPSKHHQVEDNKEQNTLWDLPKPSNKPKNSLFD